MFVCRPPPISLSPFWIERAVVVAEIEQVGDQVFIHSRQGQRRADDPEGRDDFRQMGGAIAAAIPYDRRQ